MDRKLSPLAANNNFIQRVNGGHAVRGPNNDHTNMLRGRNDPVSIRQAARHWTGNAQTFTKYQWFQAVWPRECDLVVRSNSRVSLLEEISL